MNAVQSSSWHPAPSSVSPHARGWLQNRGSLTQLIQQRCVGEFRVKPVFQSLATACGDELALMNLRRQGQAEIREVGLYGGEKQVVFAHSVVARNDQRGPRRGLNGIANRPVATVLMTEPVIKRTPAQFKRLGSV